MYTTLIYYFNYQMHSVVKQYKVYFQKIKKSLEVGGLRGLKCGREDERWTARWAGAGAGAGASAWAGSG